MILFTLKFNHLAALAVMLVCPVCKNHHYEDVSHCSRCNWSMQNDIEISQDNEILATCIPTILRSLESESAEKMKLHSIIQQLELHKADSHKLDEILDELETDRKQTHKRFEELSNIITELKSSLLASNNKSSDISIKVPEKISAIQDISSSAIEQSLSEANQTSKNNIKIEDGNSELLGQVNFQQSSSVSLPSFLQGNNHYNDFIAQSDRDANNDFSLAIDEQENDINNLTGDRNLNNNSELINEPEDSLYKGTSDRKSYTTANSQNNNQSNAISNSNYQSFYSLIKRGEIESIEVKVPQETVEQMRSGTQSELKFSNARKGNYWIINWQDTCCLIPKEKTYINPHQYGNFQRVFNCQNYQEDYKIFEVIEPARVINCDAETWRLESKGKIKFI